jgi:streptogramin lyase
MFPKRKTTNIKNILVAALIAGLLLAGCGGGTPTASPEASAWATSTAPPAQTPLPEPSPAATPTQPPPPQPSPSALPPTAAPTTAPPAGEGWTTYLGVNQVLDVAFVGDSLWAATTGGVARWDLEADTYVQYTAVDGLAANYVTGVAAAPDGAPTGGAPGGGVWFSTGAGVSRFDGSTWTTYTSHDGLAAGAPQSIAVTSGGEVWVGTTDGVSRYQPARGAWTSYLPGVRAWDVAIAPDGVPGGGVWFANHGAGINRYSPADDAWTAFTEADGRPLQGITTLVVGPEGDVWAYENYDGVYRFQGERWEKVADQAAMVCDIAFSAEGTPWLGTCGTLRSSFGILLQGADGGGWTEVEGWHPLGRPAINALAFGPAGAGEALALGTQMGIALRQDGAWRLLRGGPARNRVTAVAVTPDGAAWFGFGTDSPGTGGGGVSRFGTPASPNTGGDPWDYFLGDANVRVLAVAPDGALWAGAGCSVQRLDAAGDGTWQEMAACGDLGLGNTLDFAFGPEGEVWVATGMSLARWHEGTWQVLDRMAHAVAVAPDGTVWASGWEGAEDSYFVDRYDGSAWTATLDRSLSFLTATPDGSVWGIEAERGLARFDGEVWAQVPGPDGQEVHGALAVAPDGALWVSGPQALARFDGQAWTSYPPAGGVEALAVGPAPAGGSAGTVWLATNHGVVRFEPTDNQ